MVGTSGPKKWRKHDSWGCWFTYRNMVIKNSLEVFVDQSKIDGCHFDQNRCAKNQVAIHVDIWFLRESCKSLRNSVANMLFWIGTVGSSFFFLLGIENGARFGWEESQILSQRDSLVSPGFNNPAGQTLRAEEKMCDFHQFQTENGSPCLIGTYIALQIESRWILSLF